MWLVSCSTGMLLLSFLLLLTLLLLLVSESILFSLLTSLEMFFEPKLFDGPAFTRTWLGCREASLMYA
jgi:hypothetical protein